MLWCVKIKKGRNMAIRLRQFERKAIQGLSGSLIGSFLLKERTTVEYIDHVQVTLQGAEEQRERSKCHSKCLGTDAHMWVRSSSCIQDLDRWYKSSSERRSQTQQQQSCTKGWL